MAASSGTACRAMLRHPIRRIAWIGLRCIDRLGDDDRSRDAGRAARIDHHDRPVDVDTRGIDHDEAGADLQGDIGLCLDDDIHRVQS